MKYLLFIAFAIFVSCNNEMSRDDLMGNWVVDGYIIDKDTSIIDVPVFYLVFKDSSYQYNGPQNYREEGVWSIMNNILTLSTNIEKKTMAIENRSDSSMILMMKDNEQRITQMLLKKE